MSDAYRLYGGDRRSNRRKSDLSGLKRTVDAATEPVSLAEAKSFMRVTTADDDTFIENFLIPGSRKACEEYTRSSYITQTWLMSVDKDFGDDDILVIPRSPLISVTSVQYRNESDVLTTLDSSEYTVDTNAMPGRIIFDDIPDTSLEYRPRWEILYTAGYGAAATDVPEDIRIAILNTIAHYYEFRGKMITGTVIAKIPDQVEYLLDSYKLWRL